MFPTSIDRDLIHQVVGGACQPVDTFADLFIEYTTMAVCKVATSDLQTVEVRTRQGMGLRRVRDEFNYLVHTSSVSVAGLAALGQALNEETMPEMIMPATTPYSWEPPIAKMVQVAEETAAAVEKQGNSHIQAEVVIRQMQQHCLIGRSDGQISENVRHYAKISIEAIARQGRKIRRGKRQAGATHLADLCRDKSHLELARQTADVASRQLEASPLHTGNMTVILGPGGPATLLHEACGHALEADLARHPLSTYHGCLGQQVAAPGVTLIDNPSALSQAPIYQIDDEGEPAQTTTLIENGILRNYLYDRRTASIAGLTSNGHGRRLNYAYPPLPRMSATYLAPGHTSPEEIIQETKYGLFVQSIAGGKTDMGSGRFNLHASECYLIEDGHITAPIRGAILSGYGPEILGAIDRVGHDFEFLNLSYSCNKLDQFPLIVTVGQPTIRVQQLAVRGV